MALNKDFKVKNGLTVTESLSVGGDSRVNALTATTFEALTAKFNQTIVSTTSALSVVNNGTGPALTVQQDGSQPIAHFIDKNGDDVIIHDDGKVSIGSRTAVEQLTVTGNISATGGIKVASTTNGFVSAGRDLADIFVTEAGGGGSVTNVRGCEGITVANGTSDACVTLDLNELTTSTSDGDGDFFAVVDSSGNQKKLTKGNIAITGFNGGSNLQSTLTPSNRLSATNIGSGEVSTLEFNQLSGVTSDIQAQINSKLGATCTAVDSAKLGNVAASGYQTIITPSTRLSATNIGTGIVDNTEFNFLNGVTSNIQSQLAALSSNAPGDITGITAGGGIKGGGSTGNVDVSIFPTQSAITSIKNTSLNIGRNDDNLIKFNTNNRIDFRVNGTDGVTFKQSGEIEATSLDIEGNVDVNGSIETDGLSLSGTNVDASATEINQIHAITDGQVAASKAVIVDTNKDITGFRNLTLTGELDTGTLHTDTVTEAEFNQLSGVTSDIQAQLNSKLGATCTAVDSAKLGNVAAACYQTILTPTNRLSATNIGAGNVSTLEFNQLSAVTSDIQAQINSKLATTGCATDSAKLGNVAAACYQTILTPSNRLSATNIGTGLITNTEFNFLDGVDANIQTQLAQLSAGAAGGGTVTSITKGDGIDGSGAITTTGTIAVDTTVVRTTNVGTQSIAGNKNFTGAVQISGTALDTHIQGITVTNATNALCLGGVAAAGYQTILTPSNRLSATNIGTGVVSNVEFNRLTGVSSDIQTQFTGVTTALGQKQACLTPSNRLSATNIGSGEVSTLEFNQLSAVTSDIQAQINSKLATSGCAADSAKLGDLAAGCYQTILTPSNRLSATNIGTGVISNVEFNRLTGVSSDIQTQLAALSAGSGGCQGTVTVATAGVGIAISNCTTTPEICVNSTVVRTTGAQDIGGKKTFTDDTTITGNLSVLGAFTCIDTSITTTSALSVINAGTGPALTVQQDGSQPIAHFIDKNGDDIIFHDDGHLSIGTRENLETLTVKDSISASNAVKARSLVLNNITLTSTATELNQLDNVVVPAARFNQLSGVCLAGIDIQSQIDGKLTTTATAADSSKLGGVAAACYQTILTPANRLSATNIGTGVVSNVEFNRLTGVTSDIQTQLNAKGGGTICNLGDLGITANATEINQLDNVTVTPARFNQLSSVTSNIQTQLNAKQATLTPSNRLSATNIGTGIIDNTEFNYLNGVCFNIQSQLLALSSGAGGGGSVCQVTAGDGLGTDGANPITSTGTINIDAAQTTITSILATDLKIGEDDQTKIDFEDANTINFYADNAKQLILTDGALTPATNDDVDLGSNALEFKDGYFEGKLYADAINLNEVDVTASATELNQLDNVTVTPARFNQLSSVTSNIQTQINAKQACLTPSNRLSATNIGTGVVSNDDFGFLANTDSNIQDQLDAKEPIISASNRIGADCINSGNVSIAEFNQLSSVTSPIQGQINSKLGATATAVNSDKLGNVAAAGYQTILTPANRLSATNIGSGEVSTLKFNQLSAVTSDIQSQINTKTSNTGTVDTTGTPAVLDFARFTDGNTLSGRSFTETKSDLSLNNVENKSSATIRSEIVSGNIPNNAADTSGNAATATNSTCLGGVVAANYQTILTPANRLSATNIGAGNVSTLEFNQLSGVTSDIQAQINGKQATITGAATTITSTDLEDNRALITSSCKVAVSDITSTELNFLDGVCFNLQSQLAALSAGSGGCSGSVTSITAGSGLCGGTITNTGTISINPAQTTITSILAADVKIGEDNQTKIDFEDADTINFYANNEKQLILTDGALTPATNNNVDLGTDALEFKDGYFDGKLYADEINLNGTDITATAAEINQLDNVVVASACFNQLSSVTSPIQTQLNAKQACLTTSNRLSATNIGSGEVSTLKFNQLSAITSDIQAQINAKGNVCNLGDLGITANATEINQLDNVVVKSACFNQLSSVTSPIQAQLNTKGGGTICNLGDLGITANATEINQLDNVVVKSACFNQLSSVTSPIQAQLNAKGTVSNLADLSITANATEINQLDNVVVKSACFNQLSSVTSPIQTQLAALSAGSGGTDGTVTSVVAGTGLDGGTITNTGTISIEAAQPTITSLGTLTSLTVDDITINSSTISDGGTLIIDAAADLVLDADGGDICLKDGGTEFGRLQNSSSDFVIQSIVSDKDIIFKGSDGGSGITALTLDMSDAGSASFNHDVTVAGDLTVNGDFTCKNTLVTITSALSVVNTGTGPALTVQQDGTQPIAHFIDKNGDDIIFHDDGHLSIGTRNNCETLTVKDSISASGDTKARSFIKFGGTSSQFLKADGSVDSTAYGTVCSLSDLGINATATEINQLDNVVVKSACFNQLSSVSSNIQAQLNTKGGGTVCGLGDLGITASSAEINQLDNVVVKSACFNQLSSVTSPIQAQLNAKGNVCNLGDLGITANATEINQLDNVVVKSACFNQLSSVTSPIQAQLNTKGGGTICNLGDLGITANATEINQLDNVVVQSACFNQLSSVTSPIQTQLNAKGTVSNLGDLGINATAGEINQLDNVVVASACFNQLSSVSSNIQSQLNAKGTVSSLSDLSITANATEINQLDNVVVKSACFNQLSSVSSNIQSQLNAKGTVSSLSDLGVNATAGEINQLDNVVVASACFNQLSSVTSPIQSQLNAKGTVSSLSDLGINATAGEINQLDNVVVASACFNQLSSVTSNIQSQINAKGAGTVDTSGTPADNDFAKFTDANTIEGRSIANTKSDLSLNNVENKSSATIRGEIVSGNIPNNAADTSGNAATATLAATATALATARNIAGVSFDGTGDISLNNNAITNGAGYGTIACICTTAAGLDGGGSSGTVDLSLCLGSLATSTTDGDGDFFVVVDSSANQKKLTKGNINNSGFNNDSGFTTTNGTVTCINGCTGITVTNGTGNACVSLTAAGAGAATYGSTANDTKIDTITLDAYGRVTAVACGATGDITSVVAGTGLTGGATSGDATLNVIGGTGICVIADAVCVDGTVVRTTGTQSIGGVKSFTSAMNATSITATATVQAACFITGAYMESNAPADKVYPQGTLLALNEDGCVVESTQADSAMVFGVAAGDNNAPIVMGAEPVCITGEIEVGDYITTSDCKGHGKKAICPDFKAFGAIIGQAMESGSGDSFAIKAMIRKM